MLALPSRRITVTALLFALCFATKPLFADGGCVNSPENPTLALGLIATAAATISAIRSKYISRG